MSLANKKEVLLKFCNWVSKINDRLGYYLAFTFYFLTAFMFYEVIARYIFNAPTLWSSELSNLLFGASYMLGGGYLLLYKGHTNVDILYNYFPLKWKALIDLLTSAFTFLFVGGLLCLGGVVGWESLTNREHSFSVWAPPIYPVKLVIPLAAILILLQAVVKLINDINIVIKGRTLK